MAAVSELKEALVTEQTRALELADQSMAAVGTLLNLSMYVLGGLGVIIALIALFGYGVIAKGARDSANKVAIERMDSYIISQEFSDLLERCVRDEVKRRVGDKFILTHIKEESGENSTDPFPRLTEPK